MSKVIPPMVVNRMWSDFDVYIGRISPWGNPWSDNPESKAEFIVGSREESILRYEEWMRQRLDGPDTEPELASNILALEGKRLGCFCSPKPCHGDVLRKLFLELHSG